MGRANPGRGTKHWRLALEAAKAAGCSLKHIDAAHRFGIVLCPAGLRNFEVDQTGTSARITTLDLGQDPAAGRTLLQRDQSRRGPYVLFQTYSAGERRTDLITLILSRMGGL